MTSTRIRSGAMVMLLGLGCQAQANHILPPILPGTCRRCLPAAR